MFHQSDDRIFLTFPVDLNEENVKIIYNELAKIEIEKIRFSKVVFDLASIKNIDFFGYQMLFYFFKYLTGFLEKKDDNLIVNKSKEFMNFEEKMGLKI